MADEAVAFLAWQCHDEYLYLSDLYVASEHRHQGYARHLIQVLKQKQQNIELQVSPVNTAARHLYRQAGFQELESEACEYLRMCYRHD